MSKACCKKRLILILCKTQWIKTEFCVGPTIYKFFDESHLSFLLAEFYMQFPQTKPLIWSRLVYISYFRFPTKIDVMFFFGFGKLSRRDLLEHLLLISP